MKLDEIRNKYDRFKLEHKVLEEQFGVPESFQDIYTLIEMLDDAREVIEFYGDRNNWRYSGQDRFNNTFNYKDAEKIKTGKTVDNIGGKRARKLLEKWRKERKT